MLAIAQMRFGTPEAAPRDHVIILDTSAWMGARSGGRRLMDAAIERARAYLHAVPARDRVMLVRADALTTPVTSFEPGRRKVEEAIVASTPGSTALNIDQAMAFAISNLAWALGHVFGAGAGGAVADATSDTVPYTALALLCATTLAGLTLSRRRRQTVSA